MGSRSVLRSRKRRSSLFGGGSGSWRPHGRLRGHYETSRTRQRLTRTNYYYFDLKTDKTVRQHRDSQTKQRQSDKTETVRQHKDGQTTHSGLVVDMPNVNLYHTHMCVCAPFLPRLRYHGFKFIIKNPNPILKCGRIGEVLVVFSMS